MARCRCLIFAISVLLSLIGVFLSSMFFAEVLLNTDLDILDSPARAVFKVRKYTDSTENTTKIRPSSNSLLSTHDILQMKCCDTDTSLDLTTPLPFGGHRGGGTLRLQPGNSTGAKSPFSVPVVSANRSRFSVPGIGWDAIASIQAAFARFASVPPRMRIPAYAVTCIGVDCEDLPRHFTSLGESHCGLGYFLLVLNTDDDRWRAAAAHLSRHFAGRFFFLSRRWYKAGPGGGLAALPPSLHRPPLMGCAQSWNLIVRFFFDFPRRNDSTFEHLSMVEYVVIANADYTLRGGGIDAFASCTFGHVREGLRPPGTLRAPVEAPLIVRFDSLSMFAYTREAFETIGLFDEAVFPAYGEDVDIVYAARRLGYSFPRCYNESRDGLHQWISHVGSKGLRDPVMSLYLHRWGAHRGKHTIDKWNVFRKPGEPWEKVDFSTMFHTPWNRTGVLTRSAFAVDLAFRHCIVAGVGAVGGSCHWNKRQIESLLL